MTGLDWKGWLAAGLAGGVLWGFAAFILNALTGAFAYEGSVARNITTFVLAGAVVGTVNGGILVVAAGVMPMKGDVGKAVFVSITLWLVLRVAGFALSAADPDRYHLQWDEAAQGLFLAFVLGGLIGFMRGIVREKFFDEG